MRVAIIDNYDSFTYNLRHIIREMGVEVDVYRNDQFELPQLEPYDKLVLSPGPGIPSEAGLLTDTIKAYAASKPILGVCLGEQAIGEVFGARLVNLTEVYHGVQTPVYLSAEHPDHIFDGLPAELPVGRYHSWVVDAASIPDDLEVTATSAEGFVMALRHRRYPVHGIQFHPESVLTPQGSVIIGNFLSH